MVQAENLLILFVANGAVENSLHHVKMSNPAFEQDAAKARRHSHIAFTHRRGRYYKNVSLDNPYPRLRPHLHI